MSRGFGIVSTTEIQLVEHIAAEAEAAGYSSIWTNDTPAADGVTVAEWVLAATKEIRVGIGVAPLDRRPPGELLQRIRNEAYEPNRLILGLGAGFSERPVDVVRAGVEDLASLREDGVRIAVGAMGPAMCRLAGAIGDLALLNWVSPQKVTWARERIKEGARMAGGRVVRVAGYVRVAVGDSAAQVLAEEAHRYGSLPHYARHFATMEGGAAQTGVAGPAETVQEGLRAYDEVLDEVIVRALPSATGQEPIMEILRAAAPQRRA